MISTKKTALVLLLFFICIISATRSDAQQQRFVAELSAVAGKMHVESALIKINYKDASYADMLKIPDSALLKIEVYTKKEAVKLFGKDEGKNGVLLVTLRKGNMFQYDINKPLSHLLIGDNGDSIYCEHLTQATLGGDTTHKGWLDFLMKNLNPQTPADNSSPPGIYNVDFTFVVNKDGTVTDVKIFEDPGYGCGTEVKQLMKQSPVWVAALCENEAIKFKQEERVTFLVSED